jgi:hypothetical protein
VGDEIWQILNIKKGLTRMIIIYAMKPWAILDM